jgi:hypothetical protein
MAICYLAADDDGAGTYASTQQLKRERTNDKVSRKGTVKVRKRNGGIVDYTPAFKVKRGAASKAKLFNYFGNESAGESSRVYLDAARHGDGKFDCALHYQGKLIDSAQGVSAAKAMVFARQYMGMEAQGYEVCTYRVGSFA